MRVFYDRLVDDSDREWLLQCMRTVLKEKMGANFDSIFSHLDADKDGMLSCPECCFLCHSRVVVFCYPWIGTVRKCAVILCGQSEVCAFPDCIHL